MKTYENGTPEPNTKNDHYFVVALGSLWRLEQAREDYTVGKISAQSTQSTRYPASSLPLAPPSKYAEIRKHNPKKEQDRRPHVAASQSILLLAGRRRLGADNPAGQHSLI
jgi:hypothetical protein